MPNLSRQPLKADRESNISYAPWRKDGRRRRKWPGRVPTSTAWSEFQLRIQSIQTGKADVAYCNLDVRHLRWALMKDSLSF
jgi:hypothetical protein